MIIKELMILAGGLGTRLRSTIPNVPKVMAPINNRPFLFNILDHWIIKELKSLLFVLVTKQIL